MSETICSIKIYKLIMDWLVTELAPIPTFDEIYMKVLAEWGPDFLPTQNEVTDVLTKLVVSDQLVVAYWMPDNIKEIWKGVSDER